MIVALAFTSACMSTQMRSLRERQQFAHNKCDSLWMDSLDAVQKQSAFLALWCGRLRLSACQVEAADRVQQQKFFFLFTTSNLLKAALIFATQAGALGVFETELKAQLALLFCTPRAVTAE